ncbi:MAG TPA: energy transducer TonB [Pyrinomonadaceae bacterium]|nr:energy transducer TonB [Pyrinomonadaceae bacterium]
MKRILLSAGLLILFASGVMVQAQKGAAGWQRYTVKGEAFSVTFPTLPAMATYEENVDRLEVQRRRRVLGAYADGLVYAVSCSDNSKTRESLEDFIEQEIFTHSTFDRTSEKDLKRNGFEGKQYFAPDKVPGTVQIFSTGNAIYIFRVFGARADDTRVQQYFSSIVLGKRSSGIAVTDGLGIPYESEPKAQTELNNANPLLNREVTTKAVLVMKPEPMYTEEARQNNITGTIVLKVLFSSDGNVVNIRTVGGLPYGLTANAIEAAKKVKFVPATRDGKFVSVFMQLEYNFNLY